MHTEMDAILKVQPGFEMGFFILFLMIDWYVKLELFRRSLGL